jgi:endoglucanase
MPSEQFELMRRILAAPSPVGLEGAMTYGVLKPYFDELKLDGWGLHQFRGNAGIVLDTHPGADDMLSVMVIGHADKIRMQVRSISDDGKIWIQSDSFLPGTLIGHEVTLFSRDPKDPAKYRAINGGTIEALGAIHFADSALRSGDKGITKEMLYLELQIHGDNAKEQVEKLGISSGDPIILNRPIKRGFGPDTFYGAYLDNGLGCFVTAETARLVAEHGGFDNVRFLFAIAAYEEIGRLGSRVLVKELEPDIVIGVDVAHDYKAAPGVSDKRFTPNAMGKGFTLSVGSIVSEHLNGYIMKAAEAADIPYQKIVKGRDTGTDAMAAVFASVDAAATSLGFPIRNMHTISETGHTGDVLCAVHGIFETGKLLDSEGVSADDFRNNHARLDTSEPLIHQG